MNAALRRYPANRLGRDFVVGDIHGEFALLDEALAALSFDGGRDRLFSVGDLIDRGTDSSAALAWLERPWLGAVLGNHEAMILDTADNTELLWWLIGNGGQWWLDLDAPERQRYRAAFARLPLAIEIATADGTVGIVHADVPEGLSWREFTERLEAGDRWLRHAALWERSRAQHRHSRPIAGVVRVFSGHTPVAAPEMVGNMCLIDSGACFSGRLTIVPLDEDLPHRPGSAA